MGISAFTKTLNFRLKLESSEFEERNQTKMIGRTVLRRGLQNLAKNQRPILSKTLQQQTPTKMASIQNQVASIRTISTSKIFCTEMDSDIKSRLDGMAGQADIVIFMKGVPAAPRCGFSNAVCQILRMHDVPFESHDVLADEEVRQGIKDYSSWPTIPQVFFKGEFIGGCDILLQMHQSGELIEELQKIGITSALLSDEPEKK